MFSARTMAFIRTQGMFVHPAMAEFLYQRALELVETKGNRQPLTLAGEDGEKIGEGDLRTQYRHVPFGTMGGIEFEASVAIGARQFEIAFVIDERYLGAFVPGFWTVSIAAPACNAPPPKEHMFH